MSVAAGKSKQRFVATNKNWLDEDIKFKVLQRINFKEESFKTKKIISDDLVPSRSVADLVTASAHAVGKRAVAKIITIISECPVLSLIR